MAEAIRLTAEDRDIRSGLEEALASIEASEKPETPLAPAAPAVPESAGVHEGAAPATAVTESSPPEEATVPVTVDAAPPATEAAPPNAFETLPIAADKKEKLAKLPTEAQEFVAGTWKELQADYTRKTQEIAALKREYEPVDQLFTPFRDVMRQRGFTPASMITAWYNVEKALMEGRGIEVVKGIVGSYPIDRAHLAQALGFGGAGDTQQQPDGQPRVAPPELPPQLMQEINDLKQWRDQQDRSRMDQAAHQIMNDIETFRGAKDDKGGPTHPHFADVEADMARLARAAQAEGKRPSLQELYDSAVWANPQVRQKLLTAEKQSEKARADQEARERAARATKAAKPVTGSPGTSQPTAAPAFKSLRDEIAARVAEQDSAAA